jgi:hypothetical protein
VGPGHLAYTLRTVTDSSKTRTRNSSRVNVKDEHDRLGLTSGTSLATQTAQVQLQNYNKNLQRNINMNGRNNLLIISAFRLFRRHVRQGNYLYLVLEKRKFPPYGGHLYQACPSLTCGARARPAYSSGARVQYIAECTVRCLV